MAESIIGVDEIKSIISTKQTKICLAADVETVDDLFRVIEDLGDKICILKIHYDIIVDFHLDLENTISKLLNLKKKYNFLIWEDRKFADIGAIMERQVKTHISRWADIISVHAISCLESIKSLNFISLILIGELSTKDSIIDDNYTKKATQMLVLNDNIVGVVCQRKLTSSKLNIVPGISLHSSEDGKGQKYAPINDPQKRFADIYVIGRSILNSKSPRKTIENFLEKISI